MNRIWCFPSWNIDAQCVGAGHRNIYAFCCSNVFSYVFWSVKYSSAMCNCDILSVTRLKAKNGCYQNRYYSTWMELYCDIIFLVYFRVLNQFPKFDNLKYIDDWGKIIQNPKMRTKPTLTLIVCVPQAYNSL